MVSPNWKTLKSEFIADLKIFKARFDYLLNPHTQKEIKVTVLEANDAANVVALNSMGEIALVRQFRFGSQEYSLEIPGGFMEAGENPLEAVQRELSEETGLTSDRWEPLGVIYSNPVYQSAQIHHFIAYDVIRSSETKFDAEEFLEVSFYSPADLRQAFDENLITHPHTISAICRLYNVFGAQEVK
jgi:8-oxo-dGTP pyrophosphatase MutT (NUDIX family)